MRIVLDVMSGDKPLSEFVKGAVQAIQVHSDLEMILVGNEREIKEALDAIDASTNRIEIIHSDDVLAMEDDPMSIVYEHKNSSMGKMIECVVLGKADAAVSAGNTGALFTGASLKAKRIRGVRRSALSTIIPFECPVLLLDCGANVAVTPDHLLQFAYLGKAYMECVMNVSNPRIGLLNNGAEEHKGTTVHVEANKLLREDPNLNFIGNVEAKDAIFGKCDVLVADGFSGNVMLKTCEGMSKFILTQVKENVFGGVSGKVSAILKAKDVKSMVRRFDPREYGGAPFLGLAKPVIKAHGNSDSYAITKAIEQAIKYYETGVIDKIAGYADNFPKVTLRKEDVNE